MPVAANSGPLQLNANTSLLRRHFWITAAATCPPRGRPHSLRIEIGTRLSRGRSSPHHLLSFCLHNQATKCACPSGKSPKIHQVKPLMAANNLPRSGGRHLPFSGHPSTSVDATANPKPLACAHRNFVGKRLGKELRSSNSSLSRTESAAVCSLCVLITRRLFAGFPRLLVINLYRMKA